MTRVFAAVAVIATLSTLPACESTQQAHDEAYCKSVKPGTVTSVNHYCAVMPDDPVDPAVTPVEHRGQKVGFCCAGCIPDWEKMSMAERDAALKTAMATK